MREIMLSKSALLAAQPSVARLPDAQIPGKGSLQACWAVEVRKPVHWITTAVTRAEGQRLGYAWTRGVRDHFDTRTPRRFQTAAEREAYQAGRSAAAAVRIP
jgi:hypothetical protein